MNKSQLIEENVEKCKVALLDCFPYGNLLEEKLNEKLRTALTAAFAAGERSEREQHKSVLDDDSCECDNCHRTRRYFKNPKKEVHRMKQKLQALTPPVTDVATNTQDA